MTDAEIPIPLAREIARQGEARLTALSSLGTSADLRATTLCGIFGAVAVGVSAAVLANLVSDHPILTLTIGGAVVSLGLFLAAGIVANAAAPRDFYIAGGNPDILREWSWDGGRWRTETEMLDATADRYARSIAVNHENLELGSKRVRAALWVAGASPLVGVLAFFAAAKLL
jgi:hypothetical protein